MTEPDHFQLSTLPCSQYRMNLCLQNRESSSSTLPLILVAANLAGKMDWGNRCSDTYLRELLAAKIQSP